jgi:hypothetical protein
MWKEAIMNYLIRVATHHSKCYCWDHNTPSANTNLASLPLGKLPTSPLTTMLTDVMSRYLHMSSERVGV